MDVSEYAMKHVAEMVVQSVDYANRFMVRDVQADKRALLLLGIWEVLNELSPGVDVAAHARAFSVTTERRSGLSHRQALAACDALDLCMKLCVQYLEVIEALSGMLPTHLTEKMLEASNAKKAVLDDVMLDITRLRREVGT